jgi:hypothetical protein
VSTLSDVEVEQRLAELEKRVDDLEADRARPAELDRHACLDPACPICFGFPPRGRTL